KSADPTRFAPATKGPEHKHALLVDLSDLIDDGPVLGVDTEHIAPGFRHCGAASPDAGVGAIGYHVFDLGVCPVRRAVVARLVGGEDRTHKVQVLRHR